MPRVVHKTHYAKHQDPHTADSVDFLATLSGQWKMAVLHGAQSRKLGQAIRNRFGTVPCWLTWFLGWFGVVVAQFHLVGCAVACGC